MTTSQKCAHLDLHALQARHKRGLSLLEIKAKWKRKICYDGMMDSCVPHRSVLASAGKAGVPLSTGSADFWVQRGKA